MILRIKPKQLFYVLVLIIAGSIYNLSNKFLGIYSYWVKLLTGDPTRPAFLDQGTHYLVFNVFVLLLVFVFRKRILKILENFIAWYDTAEFKKAKRILIFFFLLVIVTYLYKFHFGFWHKGVGGWDYSFAPRYFMKSPLDTSWKQTDIPDFLILGLEKENAKYLDQSGNIRGSAAFLHYRNGEVLPFNFGILNLSLAADLFGLPEGPQSRGSNRFMRLLKEGLERQKKGTRFFLPNSISYNNHMSYMKIDYSDYPPPDELSEVTFWNTVVHVDEQRNLEVIAYKFYNRIEVQ